MRPPWDQPHSPSPQKLRGGQGRPWVLVDPPVLGPQALPVAETSVLRQQRWATGAPGAEPVMGVLKCPSTLQPHSTPEPVPSLRLQVPRPPVGEWPVRRTAQLGEEERVRTSEDIQGQWGKWESVKGMCRASRGRWGRWQRIRPSQLLPAVQGLLGDPREGNNCSQQELWGPMG